MKAVIAMGGVFCFLLAGCASSTVNYTRPANTNTPKNEIILNEPFERVWDRLVKNLSADFFVINNIEKASRLINVSFSTPEPDKYVNCGRTRRTFSNLRGEQVYDYPSANSSYFTIMSQGTAFNVSRKTDLEGRSNIYVAPEGPQKTVIRVNTRYVVTIKLNSQQLGGLRGASDATTWTFNTKDVFERQTAEPGITIKCISRGILEEKILEGGKLGG